MTPSTRTTTLAALLSTGALFLLLAPLPGHGAVQTPAAAQAAVRAVQTLTQPLPPEDDFIRSRALIVTSLMITAGIAVATLFTVGWLLQGDGSEKLAPRLPVAAVALATGVAVFVLMLHHGDRRHGVHWRTRTVHVAPLTGPPTRILVITGRCIRSQQSLPPLPSGIRSQWLWPDLAAGPRHHDGSAVQVRAFDPARLLTTAQMQSVPLAHGVVEIGLDDIPKTRGLSPPNGWSFTAYAVFVQRPEGTIRISGELSGVADVNWALRQLSGNGPRAMVVALLEPSRDELKGTRYNAHALCQELPIIRALPDERTISFTDTRYSTADDETEPPKPFPAEGIVVSADSPKTVSTETAQHLAPRADETIEQAALHITLVWDQAQAGDAQHDDVALQVDVLTPGSALWQPLARLYRRPVSAMNREALVAELQAWETGRAGVQTVRRDLPNEAFGPHHREQVRFRLRCEGDDAVARVTAMAVTAQVRRKQNTNESGDSP